MSDDQRLVIEIKEGVHIDYEGQIGEAGIPKEVLVVGYDISGVEMVFANNRICRSDPLARIYYLAEKKEVYRRDDTRCVSISHLYRRVDVPSGEMSKND